MPIPAPHFLLFSETHAPCDAAPAWQFVLESLDGRRRLVAADSEPDAHGERVELLAVVRGLEALEQPSRVILITKSRYVGRGLKRGLREWREGGWRWERFGHRVPVRDADLWQRLDRAMKIHQVECRTWRFDSGHRHRQDAEVPEPKSAIDCDPHLAARREETARAENTGQAVLIVRDRRDRATRKSTRRSSMIAWWRWFWHIPAMATTR